MPTTRRLLILLAVLLGLLLGVGGFTLHEAKAFSYLSNDSKVCVNCHIMLPQFQAWQKSSHHAVAACVDCHLPHDFIGKYLAKAANGYHHSTAFTLQDFHEPIAIKPKNAQILQANCLRCHGGLLHDLVATRDAARPGDAVQCVHCHATVGHGDNAGLGGPDRAKEGLRVAPRTT
jgi:cytochrome c nitrite reductase small subunit